MAKKVKEIGVKETLEALEGARLLSEAGMKIGADGKINTDDLKHLVNLAKKYQSLVDAFKDADMALAELKDLDEQEAIQIIAKVYEIVKTFKSEEGDK